MAVKNHLAAPLFLLLARSRELVAVTVTVETGWALYGQFRGVGDTVGVAVAVAVPLALAFGWLAVVCWISPRPGGRRPLEDVCSEVADRVADWASWDGSPDAASFAAADEADRGAV